MACFLKEIMPDMKAQYKDRRFSGDDQDWKRALATSTTVYVGNIAFTTREEQLYEVFSKVGPIDRVIMGLNEQSKTPCGFAFVQYFTRKDAEAACAYISRTKVDNRVIRVDIDWGFVDGRQYGRGRHGGQVRDDYRDDYDAGRGGYGGRAPDAVFNEALGHSAPRGQKRKFSATEEDADVSRAPPPPPDEDEHPTAADQAGAPQDAVASKENDAEHATEAPKAEDNDMQDDAQGEDEDEYEELPE